MRKASTDGSGDGARGRTYCSSRVPDAILELLPLPSSILVELLEILYTLPRGTEGGFLTFLSLRGEVQRDRSVG